MNIFSGLLFLQGHVTNVALAQRLASPVPAVPDARRAQQPTHTSATPASITSRAAGAPATTAPDR
ncbi:MULTISPECIES: hypothetical protein [Stenotrophomonas]|jgi:hypothetical protein|uniref:hypothetical protein n=1 Tax=Stenotrophomonas TaxID=40323 RepID=UPI00343E19CC